MTQPGSAETPARSVHRSDDAGADSRERILVAALEAFASNGFDGATTREIAASAGVNLGLIQYYFGGKAKLWRAAVDRAFARLRDGLEEVMGAAGPSDPRERTRWYAMPMPPENLESSATSVYFW